MSFEIEKKDEELLKIYEIGMQISPNLGQEGADNKFANIKKSIINKGGVIIQEGASDLMELAYPMYQIRENKRVKFTEAYFAWIKFEIEVNQIKSLEKELSTSIDIIRYLLFKTVRQNTFIPRKNRRRFVGKITEIDGENIIPEEEEEVDLPDPEIDGNNDSGDEDEEEDLADPLDILDKRLDELTDNELK